MLHRIGGPIGDATRWIGEPGNDTPFGDGAARGAVVGIDQGTPRIGQGVVDAVPAEIKALLKPFVCTKSASVSQVTLLGSMGTPDSSGRPTTPYDMQAEVSADQGLDIGDLASVRIDLRMTAASQEPSDPMALQDAMRNQTPVPATFTCDGDAFVVEQIG